MYTQTPLIDVLYHTASPESNAFLPKSGRLVSPPDDTPSGYSCNRARSLLVCRRLMSAAVFVLIERCCRSHSKFLRKLSLSSEANIFRRVVRGDAGMG